MAERAWSDFIASEGLTGTGIAAAMAAVEESTVVGDALQVASGAINRQLTAVVEDRYNGWFPFANLDATPPPYFLNHDPSGREIVAVVPWAAETVVAIGEVVFPTTPNGYFYECVTPGETGETEPAEWGTSLGDLTTDSAVEWRCHTGNVLSFDVPYADFASRMFVPFRYIANESGFKLYAVLGTEIEHPTDATKTLVPIYGNGFLSTDSLASAQIASTNKLVTRQLNVDGVYGASVADIGEPQPWLEASANLIGFFAMDMTPDGTVPPKVSIKGGTGGDNAALTDAGTAGSEVRPVLGGTNSLNDLAVVTLNAPVPVSLGVRLQPTVVTAGDTGDAEDLRITAVFLKP